MANLFLETQKLLQENDSLNYINYSNINENQKEFLRSDLWDWKFTLPPAAVYYPGDEIFQTRLTTVAPTFSHSPAGGIDITIRGYQISQKVGYESHGSVTLTFEDREDQSITAFFFDWQEKLTERSTKYTFRKEDTYAEAIVTQFNSSRIPIRRYQLLTCQLASCTPSIAMDSATAPSSSGNISAEIAYEHHIMELLNLPS
jgi:hypothetical protein